MALDSARLRLPLDWQLPPTIARRLGERAGRQRAIIEEEHLLLVLHEPPLAGTSERHGRLFWRDKSGTWRSSSHGTGVQGLREHLSEYNDHLERLEKDLENADTADEYYALLRAVVPLHRSARNLHVALQQAREGIPGDSDLINARDQSVEIERALDLLHSDASHGLDFTVARHAEEQTEAAHQLSVAGYRLNLLAAAFLPVATIGSIFGMNLSHGFEGPQSTALFWSLLFIGLFAGFVLALAIAKRPRTRRAAAAGKRPPAFYRRTPQKLRPG